MRFLSDLEELSVLWNYQEMGLNESRYMVFYVQKNKSDYLSQKSSFKLSAVSQKKDLKITADFYLKTNSV